jgi:DNA-binding transcriptional regulator/RsmH inhibitor MraZ
VIKASGIDSIMITRMDRCLFAYTHDQWGKLEQKILDLPEKKRGHASVSAHIYWRGPRLQV